MSISNLKPVHELSSERIKMVPIDFRYLQHYKNMPLFISEGDGNFVLYKSRKENGVENISINHPNLKGKLFLMETHYEKAFREAQNKNFSNLESNLEKGEIKHAKQLQLEITHDILNNPLYIDSPLIDKNMKVLLSYLSRDKGLMNEFLLLQSEDKKIAEHSLEACLYTARYYLYNKDRKYDFQEILTYCSAALLHDIGYSEVPEHIRNKKERLATPEFNQLTQHTIGGYNYLRNKQFPEIICKVAREHHKREDGSGYPKLKIPTADISRTVTVIESLLDLKEKYHREHPEMPYKDTISNALRIIAKDVNDKKLSQRHYVNLVLSLGN